MPRDPYRNFRFEVEIDGFIRAGFAKVSGLKHSIEVISYRESGENERMRKLPGQSDFEAITLERGMSNDEDFSTWIRQVFDLDKADGQQGDVEGWRKDIVIYLKDKSNARVKKWTVLDAWPSEDSVGDLDAAGNDVLISSLVLQNEGVKRENLAG